MKKYDTNEEPSSTIKYLDVNNLYGLAVSQKLPINVFKWAAETFQFIEDYIENYNEDSDVGCFLKLMFKIVKNCTNFIMIYFFA